MAKSSQKNGKKKKGQKVVQRTRAVYPSRLTPGAYFGLDRGALEYRKLLSDPCNAAMVYPVYGSTNNGYLLRVKQIFTLNSSAVDWVFEVCPSRTSFGIWGGANTNGGSLGTWASGIALPNFLTGGLVHAYRPVAGCIRVMYSGTEAGRSGTVSLASYDGALGAVGGTVSPSVAFNFQNNALQSKRTGAELEMRWVPGVNDISNWYYPNQTYTGNGTALQVVGVGTPAGSTYLETTFVWEWLPDPSTSMANSVRGPVSRNTMQEVLRSIGDLGNFIVDAMPTFRAAHSSAAKVFGVIGSQSRQGVDAFNSQFLLPYKDEL